MNVEKYGFRLNRMQNLQQIEAVLHEMEHIKTGAKLIWLERAEQNKTFSVAFQTLPEDDTGVFHILEHSVLCGSEKYPLKEPFVELMKGSMNTFLNAMTFPDKTMYPVASQNDADFRNLVSVYLDAVFAPAIYKNKNIFLQEGWHYEPGENGMPNYVGVVFGEMKGAFSSVDEVIRVGMNRMLYPDSCYGFVSGGDPEHIPELSYEQFLAAHTRYYHPSNAYFFLDGNVNIEQFLHDLDTDYLCHYERRESDFALREQRPIPFTQTTVEYEIAPGEDGEGKAHFAMGRVVASWKDVEKIIAMHVLADYLADSNQSPLARKVLERRLGQDVNLKIMDGIAQPFMLLQIQNCNAEKLPNMWQEVEAILQQILAEGLDRQELAACLNRQEFYSREQREPFGIHLAIAATNAWLYGGDPAMYLETEAFYRSIRQKLDSDYFTQLMREMLLGDEGMAALYVLPSDSLGQKKIEAEQAKIEAACLYRNDEDRAALACQQEALLAWQRSSDTEEALASIPHLERKDLPEQPSWTHVAQETVCGVPVLRPDVKSGTVYINLYFELPEIAFSQLPAITLMTKMFGVLPTNSRTAQMVQRDIKTHLGALNFKVMPLANPGDCEHCRVYLHAHCSVLPQNTEDAVRIVREVLLDTDFCQPELVQQTLQQTVIVMQQGIIMGGHQAAFQHALANQTAEEYAAEWAQGYSAYAWLRDAAADFDGKWEDILAVFASVRRQLTAANLTVGVTGAMDTLHLQALCGTFPAGQKRNGVLTFAPQENRHEAICIPAGIAFAVQGGNLYRMGYTPHGSMQLMSKLLSLNYLWNEVRVQGGAYGAGFAIKDNGSLFSYSYRDPNPARSLDIYSKTAAFLRQACEKGERFDQLLIGAVSDSDPLLSAKDKSALAIQSVLRGITFEVKQQQRRQLLQTTQADLVRCCEMLDRWAKEGEICVVGAEPLLDACGDNIRAKLYC